MKAVRMPDGISDIWVFDESRQQQERQVGSEREERERDERET